MNLSKYITDERTGITYELVCDYYFIAGDDDEPEDNLPIGRWGRMREEYLMKNKRYVFDSMLMSGKLHSCLSDIDEQAREMFDNLVEQMREAEEVTEQLKEQDQFAWVQRMGNIQQRAQEIVRNELIYV
ncbi:MAG: TnpV protein [Clostridia bacterium]|nr:TnpV protein [Clostridia bacterium]